MLFSSYEFIAVFMPIVFVLYRLCIQYKQAKLAVFTLIMASLFYYAYWKPIYIILILASMFFNYLLGIKLSQENKNKKLPKIIKLKRDKLRPNPLQS